MTTAMDESERDRILRFYEEAGLSSVEAEAPGGLWAWNEPPKERPAAAPAPKPAPVRQPSLSGVRMSTDEALRVAEESAAGCGSLEELVAAIAAFEGCPLKEGARGPVVYDGVLGADILVMGEAPGREEDRLGKPFVGRSGQLLDRMLAAIGLARAPSGAERPVCISNAIYWRPPGNRNPSKAEIAVCLPFMRRFIALSKPRLMLLTGNVPTQALFPDAPGITRARGQMRLHTTEDGQDVPALPLFHPAFLLRQPTQKRWAWRDLLTAQAKLNETSA